MVRVEALPCSRNEQVDLTIFCPIWIRTSEQSFSSCIRRWYRCSVLQDWSRLKRVCRFERIQLISCSAPGRTSMRLDVRADADMICALHLPPQLACLTTGTTELDDQPVDGFMRRILYGASARRKIQDCIFNMLSAASCLAETNLHTLRGLTASGFCSSSSWRSCFFWLAMWRNLGCYTKLYSPVMVEQQIQQY